MADFPKILFVCLGNICRSPAAECVFRQRLDSHSQGGLFHLDSAGTIGFHRGAPPDSRMVEAGRQRGIIIKGASRPVAPRDFQDFDLILGMDEANVSDLRRMCPFEEGKERIHLFLPFCGVSGVREVPDPYYGGEDGFEHVLDLLEDACGRLAKKLLPGDFRG